MSLNYQNKYSLAWSNLKNLLQNAVPADVELIDHLVSQTEIKTCITKKNGIMLNACMTMNTFAHAALILSLTKIIIVVHGVVNK